MVSASLLAFLWEVIILDQSVRHSSLQSYSASEVIYIVALLYQFCNLSQSLVRERKLMLWNGKVSIFVEISAESDSITLHRDRGNIRVACVNLLPVFCSYVTRPSAVGGIDS